MPLQRRAASDGKLPTTRPLDVEITEERDTASPDTSAGPVALAARRCRARRSRHGAAPTARAARSARSWPPRPPSFGRRSAASRTGSCRARTSPASPSPRPSCSSAAARADRRSGEVVRAKWHDIGQVSVMIFAPAPRSAFNALLPRRAPHRAAGGDPELDGRRPSSRRAACRSPASPGRRRAGSRGGRSPPRRPAGAELR